MSEKEKYWAHKLDKIQYALWALRRVMDGRDISTLINFLEEQEVKATNDLIEAERANSENWEDQPK